MTIITRGRDAALRRPVGAARRPYQLVTQFDVPVGKIYEVLPAVVLVQAQVDLHKRTPLRPLRFADQTHVRFARKPIALLGIAADTRTHNVFPRRGPSPIARHNVIQIEFASIENLTAVLAGVLVALENVVTGKFYFLLWKPIENEQDNHAWDTNLERNSRDYFVVGRVRR